MIANMHTFFFLHARFVFKQIILKNSLKLSIHNTHTHTQKKVAGKRQEDVTDAEMNRQGADHRLSRKRFAHVLILVT